MKVAKAVRYFVYLGEAGKYGNAYGEDVALTFVIAKDICHMEFRGQKRARNQACIQRA